jgi:cytochrome c oxidase cbb3-type subunit 3
VAVIALAPFVFAALSLHDAALGRRLLAAPATAPLPADLARYVRATADRAFRKNCESCHGEQLIGDPERGAPRLIDGVWLFGSGEVGEIERTLRSGVRAGRPGGRSPPAMPAYGPPRLPAASVEDLMAHLYALRGIPSRADAVRRGAALYASEGCGDCHGAAGRGDRNGAPDLTDREWLYGGGDPREIRLSIANGRSGACPGFEEVLSPPVIRAMALRLRELSGAAPN